MGGRIRRRVVILLACVLALDTADMATIGATAGELEHGLGISNAQLGLLVSVPSLIGALATIPVGVLADRVLRVRLLAGSVLVWSIAMAASGLATSFAMLLITRVALGAVTATAGPTISSLIGDFIPARERGRIYGFILSGELLGAAFGFLVSGESAAALSWRAAFIILALPSLALAVALWRLLPEPARGGESRLQPGATRFTTHSASRSRHERRAADPETESLAQANVREHRVSPRDELILIEDPTHMSLWEAFRYTLRIPTNVILIVASALGYFYFAGVQTFGLVYFRRWYGVSHTTATLLLTLLAGGAIVGVLASGRLADRLIRRGRLDGRIIVGGWSYILATACFLPALLSRSLILSVPLLLIAAAALAARNPPLDAARLDVMHSRLWGRAEAVRTVLRRGAVATAPLLFGLLADSLNSGRHSATGQHGFGSGASPDGLHYALLILLVTLTAGGLLTFKATRTYPRDVATASASERQTDPADE